MTTCAHICTKYTHMFMDHFYLGMKGLSLNWKLIASAKLPGLELQGHTCLCAQPLQHCFDAGDLNLCLHSRHCPD